MSTAARTSGRSGDGVSRWLAPWRSGPRGPRELRWTAFGGACRPLGPCVNLGFGRRRSSWVVAGPSVGVGGLSSHRRCDGARGPGGGPGPAAAARSPAASLDHHRNPEQGPVAPTRGETPTCSPGRPVCPGVRVGRHRPWRAGFPPGAGLCPDPASLGERGQAAFAAVGEPGSWRTFWSARCWAGS